MQFPGDYIMQPVLVCGPLISESCSSSRKTLTWVGFSVGTIYSFTSGKGVRLSEHWHFYLYSLLEPTKTKGLKKS